MVYTALELCPIGTDKPELAGKAIANDQPPNSLFQGHSPPFPTCTWWVGYAAGEGNAVCAGPFPYETCLAPYGIKYGISATRQFDGTSVKQLTQNDWCASFVEHSKKSSDHKVISWDTQSVTLGYFTGPKTLTSYLVPGSPYLTFVYNNATPIFISEQGPIISFNDKPPTKVSTPGTKFKVATWIAYQDRVVASSPLTGVIRMVKLNDPSHERILDDYVGTYPTTVKTSYLCSSTDSSAILRFTWSVVGNPAELLMMTWPHHRMKMQTPTFPPVHSLSYLTTKGYMYPALGNVWDLKYDLPNISWNAPRPPDESCLPAIIQGLEYETGQLDAANAPAPGDFYFWGGAIAAKARLALIAEHVERQDLIPRVVEYLKASYKHWFDSSSPIQAAYETAWGGLINKSGYNNFWVDFGNGYYNDHHFHYGYFLEAAATISRYNKQWLSEHKSHIDWFLRDIVNPSISDDPYFTFTRHLDVFACHSWASGIGNGAGSRDQESIGEAVNGYYGAMLWAEITGRANIVKYCRLLIAMEQHAARVYWHLYPESDGEARDQPYPEPEVRSLVTIGNVQDWQAGAWLFWGNQKVQIAAIQILPVIPVNEYMYDPAWARNVLVYTAKELRDPAISDDWKSLIYCAYSQYNPQKAAELSSNLMAWGTGNTYTNQLYFISTRPNPSRKPIFYSAGTNPTGHFMIQLCATGRYVTSSPDASDLIASADTTEQAEVFEFSFAPNSGTMRSLSSAMFVTADQSGTATLAASRGVALAWEMFMIRPREGKDEYWMKAGSNRKFITVGADGRLVNSADSAASGASFRFVPPPSSWIPPKSRQDTTPEPARISEGERIMNLTKLNPEGQFVIQEATAGRYIVPSAERNLQASATSYADAEVYVLNAGTITASSTSLFVTADISGSIPLSAARSTALAWEMFIISPKSGGDGLFTIRAGSNCKHVLVQSDGSLVNDANTEAEAAVFRLLTPHPTLLVPNLEGKFILQSTGTASFITCSPSSPTLTASASSTSDASVFELSNYQDSTSEGVTVAEGGTLKLLATQQFVTADISGSSPLAANRLTALAWEYFTIRRKIEERGGNVVPVGQSVYTIRARSNGGYVRVTQDGGLINDGKTAVDAEGFRFLRVTV